MLKFSGYSVWSEGRQHRSSEPPSLRAFCQHGVGNRIQRTHYASWRGGEGENGTGLPMLLGCEKLLFYSGTFHTYFGPTGLRLSPPDETNVADRLRRDCPPRQPCLGDRIPTLRQARLRAWPGAAMCVRKMSAQCVLQLTPSLAASCVLHRPTSRVIHRLESWIFPSIPVFQVKTAFSNWRKKIRKTCSLSVCHKVPCSGILKISSPPVGACREWIFSFET